MTRGHYIDPKAGRLTVRQHADRWLNSLTMDPGTFVGTEQRVRLHILPYLGSRPLGSLRPIHIREWLRELQDAGIALTYQRVIFATLSAMLTAAVDDQAIPSNPCRSSSVRVPKADPRRVVPWERERVFAVRAALPAQYRALVDLASGCGLRQGEVLGLAVEDIDFAANVVHVIRQVKRIRNRPLFASPKSGKPRTVPLPASVARRLREHIVQHPSTAVTLPWRVLDGKPVTATLLFHHGAAEPVNRNTFNRWTWRPALAAVGVPYGRENGTHALRHFYASVLLDAGESVKALSEYLGHHDPGFTLRTYTHLMQSSETRTRSAVDRVFGGPTEGDDGPTTAQAA
ncbi:tyrosine-type recombinase/integrase [Streptomyces sp. NPDC050523]|uniref:tyrosine-type recombinase/integrase n=1 Tax=Streptomyces sp. NPDC050523 TaxID=3365622 RepID=UPI0037B38E92